jgi:hypothetical protein
MRSPAARARAARRASRHTAALRFLERRVDLAREAIGPGRVPDDRGLEEVEMLEHLGLDLVDGDDVPHLRVDAGVVVPAFAEEALALGELALVRMLREVRGVRLDRGALRGRLSKPIVGGEHACPPRLVPLEPAVTPDRARGECVLNFGRGRGRGRRWRRLVRGWFCCWLAAGRLVVFRLVDCGRGYETAMFAWGRGGRTRLASGARHDRAGPAIRDVLARAAEVDPPVRAPLAERELVATVAQDRGDAVRSEEAPNDRVRHDVPVAVLRRILQAAIDAPRPQRVQTAERLVAVVARELAEDLEAHVFVHVGSDVDAGRFPRGCHQRWPQGARPPGATSIASLSFSTDIRTPSSSAAPAARRRA